MKQRISTIVVALLIAIFGVASLLPASLTGAEEVEVFKKACDTNPSSVVCQSKDEGATREDAAKRVQVIINTILMVLGIVAVIVIIIGGFRYVTSQGDENGVKQGKNSIIYAVVGLVIAMLAFVIVNFFVFSFTPKP